jgi:hypothetical protein
VCHVLNKVPTKNKEITPFEEWEKKRLNLSYFCTYGCLAKVNVPINKKHKFGPKIFDCVFLGYAIHNVGYMFLIINSGVPNMLVGTIMEFRDAIFFEREFSMKNTPSTSSHESIIPHEQFIPIEHFKEPLVQNSEKDDIVVTQKVREKGLQSLLVMTILCTLWMTHQEPLKRHTPLLMLTFGRKQYGVRWIQLCLMELGKLLNVLMGVNL